MVNVDALSERFVNIRVDYQDDEKSVIAGFDKSRARPCVIRSVPRSALTDAEYKALVAETSALAGPFGVELIESGPDLLFIRPVVEGDLLSTKIAGTTLFFEEILDLAIVISRELVKLHGAGFIHAGLNPQSIVIRTQTRFTADERYAATLIEGGAVYRSIFVLDTQAAETIAYLSPEQTGLLRNEVSASSDLYALGALFYALVEGKPPIGADSLHDLLRRLLHTPPAALSFTRSDIPEVFIEMVRRLLAQSPEDRYHTALGVLKDLEKLRTRLSETPDVPLFAIGQDDVRTTLAQSVLVGRSREIQAFLELAENLKQGKGALLTLEGASGLGKTRLMDRWVAEAKRLGLTVYRGQALHGADHQPFQVLADVATQAMLEAEQDKRFQERLLSALGDDVATLAVMLPQMHGLVSYHQHVGEPGPESFGIHRSQRAGALFFDGLGGGPRPAVLFLDDCQWADSLVIDSLEYWLKHSAEKILIVVALRAEDTQAARRLLAIDTRNRLRLDPLNAQELEEMATSIAGPLPAEALGWLHRLSDGNPFFADALLRGMVETGYLGKSRQGWIAHSAREGELRLTQRAATYFAHCVALLPQDVREFLAAGAVLGPGFSLTVAGRIAKLEASRLPQIFKCAKDRRLLWIDGDSARFVHDKVRETVLSSLSEDDRKETHRLAALAIATSDQPSSWVLAHHYSRAGLAAEALPHALEAAAVARARFALDLAEDQLRIAASCCPPNREDIRLRIHESLGDVFMLRGNYAPARAELDHALTLAAEPDDKIRSWEKLGELHFKMGNMSMAMGYLEAALTLLGQPVPKSNAQASWFLLRSSLRQFRNSLRAKLFPDQVRPPVPEVTAQIARILNRLAYVYWFAKGGVPCIWAQFAAMNMLEDYGPCPELAQSYSNHAASMSIVGLFARGERYGKRSIVIREHFGDIWGKGQTQHFLGVLYYAGARYHDCIEICRAAHAALLRTGDLWEVDISGYQIAASSYRLGLFEQSRALCEDLYSRARDIGDHQTTGIILDVWARAAPRDVPEVYLSEALTHRWEDAQAFAQVRLAAACVALSKRDPTKAIEWLDEGIRRVEAKPISNGYVAPLYSWMLTAMRQRLDECPLSSGRQRRQIKREWKKRARAATIMAWRFPGERPRVLRERAIVVSAVGKMRRGLRLVKASVHWARQQGQKHEEVESLHLMANLLADMGDSRAANVRAEALRVESAVEAKPARSVAVRRSTSLSLLDLFDTLLRCGREIAGSLSISEVLHNLQKSGHELLRGDRCVVLAEKVASKEISVVCGDGALNWLKSIVDEATLTRAPVVRQTAAEEPAPGSACLEKLEIVLCAPVLALGEIKAYLYVTCSRLDAGFHEDAKKISQLLCAVAGAAIENSILYQEKLESNRLKDEFIATVSHELRTPMTAIKGWIHLLATGAVADSELPMVHDILKRNVESELHLIEDLLDISRISANQIKLYPETVRLDEIVVAAVQTVLSSAMQKQIDLQSDCQTQNTLIHCDPARVQQILWNVLANAIKFTPEKGKVSLVVRRIGKTIEMRITDTGRGISSDFLPHLFEKFRQEDSSRRRPHGGLGLGLTIVKSLVDLHGGTIEARSEGVNRGSEFTVRLPIGVEGRV